MKYKHTIDNLLKTGFARHQNTEAYVHKETFRTYRWTYGDVQKLVSAMQYFLSEHNLQKGDRLMICAPNSPWWAITYFACARSGIVLVPVDFNSHPDFVKKVAKQTNPKLLILSIFRSDKLSLKSIVAEDLKSLLKDQKIKKLTPVKITSDDILEIVFTSGSTGDPKGVVLTQGNVASNVANLLQTWSIGPDHVLLSLIPLSHMFEQTIGLFTPFASGSKVVYITSIKPSAITAALKDEQVTTLAIVPAFLSLLRRRIIDESGAGAKQKVLQALFGIAKHLSVKTRRIIFKPIHNKIGPSLQYMIVGGAPLPVELETFWSTLGINVLQGYGMTETAPIATYSLHTSKKPGSVGKSLPNQKISIAEDGEILMQGPHVFNGYYKDKKATNHILKNNWLHTGDIGELDDEGFLFLRGRKKNMLLSENGLNIYPEDIESQLMNSAKLKDVVVLMSTVNNNPVLTGVFLTDLTQDKVQKIVNSVNLKLAGHQAIQRIVIWPEEDFPRTATRKVKRLEVQKLIDDTKTKQTVPKNSLTAVQEILSTVIKTGHNIKPNSTLAGDLGLDSLNRLELVTLLEEKLFAVIGEDQITQTTTVSDLETIVQAALKSPRKTNYKLITSEKEPLMTLKTALQDVLLVGPSLYQKMDFTQRPAYSEPVVFVANHTSHFDSLTFLRWLDNQRKHLAIAAAKDYFFKNPLKAWGMRRLLNAFPVDRDGNIKQSLLTIGTYLDAGKSVLIFPEGTRSIDGSIQPFKPGIGLIAQLLEVPVVPVKLTGNFAILPKGQTRPKRGKTTIIAGKPLNFSRSANLQEIPKIIKQALEEL